MLFPIAGSVYQTVKRAEMTLKWQEKKKNPRLQQDVDPERKRLAEQAAQVRESNAVKALDTKLKSGASLTPEELDFLKTHNPKLYQEAISVEEEKNAYEESLNRCRTKEEVNQEKMNKVQSYLTQAKTIANNTAIPLSARQAYLDGIMRRVSGIERVHQDFVKSQRYQSLPEDEEERLRRQELLRGEIAEDAGETKTEEPSEETENTEGAGETDGDTAETEGAADAEKAPEKTPEASKPAEPAAPRLPAENVRAKPANFRSYGETTERRGKRLNARI